MPPGREQRDQRLREVSVLRHVTWTNKRRRTPVAGSLSTSRCKRSTRRTRSAAIATDLKKLNGLHNVRFSANESNSMLPLSRA